MNSPSTFSIDLIFCIKSNLSLSLEVVGGITGILSVFAAPTINAATIGNTGAAFTGATVTATSTGNFGGGLFGTSQTAQSGNQQQQDIKHASLNDPNPYGQTSIWTGLPVWRTR